MENELVAAAEQADAESKAAIKAQWECSNLFGDEFRRAHKLAGEKCRAAKEAWERVFEARIGIYKPYWWN